MAIPELKDFNLAGGTSLALQIGHRESYDLDFFGKRPFTSDEMLSLLAHIGPIEISHKTSNILTLNVDGVKVDFVNYMYPLLKEPIEWEGIRLLQIQDIAGMKLSAITGRGRKRDFFDFYFLLQYYSFTELMEFYRQKFADGNEWLIARSISYFNDAEEDEDPKSFLPAPWNEIKEVISKHALQYFG
jgi:Nucleotidyl transferase AbiEii toxin, Type IV TA system